MLFCRPVSWLLLQIVERAERKLERGLSWLV